MSVTRVPLPQRPAISRDVVSSAADSRAMIGNSSAMDGVRRRVAALARAERTLVEGKLPPVLITGETGTGKELVARALHASGARSAMVFLSVNCAAIPANLLESEFFGHERGAFTDARTSKPGLFEAAAGGTLFLDEIGELELPMQAKLLRAIETHRIRRVGALQDIPTDVRILAATNRGLQQRVQEGEFRADLYYRLRVATIELPSLRARGPVDVLMLAEHFLQHEALRYGRAALRLSPAARETLLHHDWPGNIRELRHVIERAVVYAEGPLIEPSDLELIDIGEDIVAPAIAWRLPPGGVALPALEASLIGQAMQHCNGNITRAANMLGLSRDTLRYRLDKHRDPARGRT
jgi:two-component system, NtrC family, response regulator AtoC